MRSTSHAHAGHSPGCKLGHAWLLRVESRELDDPETGPYWNVEEIDIALLTVLGEDAKHVIGKGGCMLQYLQALQGHRLEYLTGHMGPL